MESTDGLNREGDAAASGSGSPSESGLLEDAKSLWQELLGLAHEQLTLAGLEARLAGKSLVAMVAAGVMVAVLLISAWLALLAAVVLWLIGIGITASIGLLLAVAANLVLALILYNVIRRQSSHLRFSATLRSLRPVPSKLQGSGSR